MEYVTSVERIGMEKGSLNLLCRQIAKRFKTGYDIGETFSNKKIKLTCQGNAS